MSTTRGEPSIVDPVIRPGKPLSARRYEKTDRLVRNIVGSGSTRVTYRNGKIHISGGGQIDTWVYFGFRLLQNNTIRIKARSVVFHSSAQVAEIAEQDILLSGNEAWIYASVNRMTNIATVSVSATRPASDGTFLNLVLYRFDLSGSSYALAHCGWWDFNFHLPLA